MTAALSAFESLMPQLADAAMARANFERFRVASPEAMTKLSENAPALSDLAHVFASSQFLADVLINDAAAVELLLEAPAVSPSTAELTRMLSLAVEVSRDEAGVMRAIRRFRRQQTLRIAVNDLLRDRPLEEITRDLCRIADATIAVALAHALQTLTSKHGTPRTSNHEPARITALAFGKLGGDELNYSSDLDLMFVADDDGVTAKGLPNAEFFNRAITQTIRLVSAHTDLGVAYRIDLRLRPEGAAGPLVRSLPATLSYYDIMGRTWERQALIKLRHVGGDVELGRETLKALEPFVYRKYFSFSEINEVKVLKRQMEARAGRGGDVPRDVKTGRGGIRDIEFTVQFLQLLNGGDLPAVRQRNTLLALEALEIAGCLTGDETYRLADAYRFLRRAEHRLQLLFDLQTHALPANDDALAILARRMGYESRRALAPVHLPESGFAPQRRSPLDEPPPPSAVPPLTALQQFKLDLQEKTALDRSILDHLLHQTFAGMADVAEPESDLILDPAPDAAAIQEVLGKYRFNDCQKAYAHLMQLARESVRFLSHRRCRHFLASIAPALLRAVAETPNPDEALAHFEQVTASLGAKAVLYEAFSFNPPSLKLYVDLCAGSPFLSGLLMNNPGMIDELVDSLVLDQPRRREELAAEIAELLRGAVDPDPILHSFRDKELLRVGVHDLLGKSLIQNTDAALSDIAEAIVVAVAHLHTGPAAPLFILGLGKLGGREINYHSDLDLLFVADDSVEIDLQTLTESVQRLHRTLTTVGPRGRLYPVDLRLRPFGKSGKLVVTLSELQRYFQPDGEARLWERQALGRARLLGGGDAARINALVHDAMTARAWTTADTAELRTMRFKLQAACGPRNIKRGPGGLADIEFIIQLFQLKYGHKHRGILKPNVWDVFFPLRGTGLVTPTEATALAEHYTFLRSVESKLRIVTDRPLNDVPDDPVPLAMLARRLGFTDHTARTATENFLREFARVTTDVRVHFEAITQRELSDRNAV
jgi:glutamate-ammonia-ligase adenylyltransferase